MPIGPIKGLFTNLKEVIRVERRGAYMIFKAIDAEKLQVYKECYFYYPQSSKIQNLG